MDASAFVDRILNEDRQAPLKQRHTTRQSASDYARTCQASREEARARPLRCSLQEAPGGVGVHEAFVPQRYDWGVEAQVDWYGLYADLSGERIRLAERCGSQAQLWCLAKVRTDLTQLPLVSRYVRRRRQGWEQPIYLSNCLDLHPKQGRITLSFYPLVCCRDQHAFGSGGIVL